MRQQYKRGVRKDAAFFSICGRLYVHELDGQSQLGGVGGLVGAVGGGAFDVDVAEVAVGVMP